MSIDSPDSPKRLASRFLAGLPTILHLGEEEHACSAFNLSRNGVMLVGPLPLVEGKRVRVSLRTPGEDLRLDLEALVARARRLEESDVELGLAFEDVPDALLPQLDALISRVVEGMAPAPIELLAADAGPEQIRKALEQMSVPHRMNLAGRATSRERHFLLHDPKPPVLEALARNPQTTSPEMTKILRLPHLLPNTLELIARDPRWLQNEEIRLAIVTHPRTPWATADQILSQLTAAAIQKVLRRPGLHPALREKLMAKLTRPQGGRPV